jgi:Zn-dependent protease with chaperone function
MSLKPNIREFSGLSHLAFQHPMDAQARVALEKIPLLPTLTKSLSGAIGERFIRIQQISGSLRISSNQYPSLHKQYLKMAQILDVQKLPDLYITTSPTINAYAMGADNYFIVVTSGLIDIMTEDELLAIIGHELGHVKCEHMLYVTMANMLRLFGANILEQFLPGVGQLASIGIQLALLEWYRKAEFSCDRAALLAVQEPQVVSSALAKLAGFSRNLNETFSIDEVKKQAQSYQDIGANSLIDKIIKVYVLLGETHPYPVVRVNEIGLWAESPEYTQILNGNFPKLTAAQNNKMLPMPPLATPMGLMCPNPKCKSIWISGTSFCGKCTTSLKSAQSVCGQCMNFIDPNWAVCSNCGNKLKTGM